MFQLTTGKGCSIIAMKVVSTRTRKKYVSTRKNLFLPIEAITKAHNSEHSPSVVVCISAQLFKQIADIIPETL